MRKFVPAPPAVLAPAAARLLALAALGLLLLAGGSRAGAAAPADSIAITSPNNTTIAESDDYATQALGDPWDMNNLEDSGYLDRMTPPVIQNGIWSSQTTDQYGSIFLQSQGWPLSAEYLGEHNGANYPINTRQYTHLRFRMYSSVADRAVVWWYATHNWTPGGNAGFVPTQAGWHIYDIDLAANLPGSNGHWTDQPVWQGLRLDPVFYMGHTNVTIQLDWVRLTPASGSNLNIAWTASGSSPVNLYLATSPGGADEFPIATDLASGTRSYNWNSAGIAPGTYYVHAVMGGASTYSGPLNINQAPVFNITAPSPSSGEDYATTVLGRPWNGRDPAQFQATYNITGWTAGPGYLQTSSTNNDPELWLLNIDAAHPIDTVRYHYFTYNLYLARPNYVNNGQYLFWNGGPRTIWSRTNQPLNWQQTELVIGWYDRWLHVAQDLRTFPLIPGQNNEGWTGQQTIFRFDPHEEAISGQNVEPPFFRVGELRLTADPTVSAGRTTTISWTPGKTGGNLSLVYSPTPGGTGTLIATVPLAAGGYAWTVTGLAPGTYWVTGIANDGLNTFGQTALAPLVVTAAPPQPCHQTFSDVAAPYAQYIDDLYCRNLVDGYSDNTFRPYAGATRATLAQWIVRLRGWSINTAGGPHFADVLPTNPFYPYVETAYNHQVLSGYGDGTFHPDDLVTRGQMSKMLVNGFGWAIDTSGGPHFSDVPPSNPFYQQIETIFNHGLVSGYGDGTFRWGNPLIRGQLTKVLDLAR